MAYKNGVSGPFWCVLQPCVHHTWAVQGNHVACLVRPMPAEILFMADYPRPLSQSCAE